MTVETKLRARVVAQVPAVGQRVYRDMLPLEVTLPAIVYQLLPGGVPWNTHDPGPPTGGRSRVQWSVWAGSGAEADSLAAQLIQAIGGWRERTTPPRIDGVLIESLPASNFEPDSEAKRAVVDSVVLHQIGGE